MNKKLFYETPTIEVVSLEMVLCLTTVSKNIDAPSNVKQIEDAIWEDEETI